MFSGDKNVTKISPFILILRGRVKKIVGNWKRYAVHSLKKKATEHHTEICKEKRTGLSARSHNELSFHGGALIKSDAKH